VAAGDLTTGEAAEVAKIIDVYVRTLSATDFEERLERLERAAEMLRNTDHSVADICFDVGLASVGSFTTSFRRVYGMTPTEYRALHPPLTRARIPTCVLQAYARPVSSFREDRRVAQG